MRIADVRHQLGITEPAIGRGQGRGQEKYRVTIYNSYNQAMPTIQPGDRYIAGLKLHILYDDKWKQPASVYLCIYAKA